MDKNLIAEIINKFLEGNCSDEEFAYLLYWYESFDENIPVQLTEGQKELLRLNMWGRIKTDIPELETYGGKEKTTRTGNKKNIFLRSWKYAAAAIVTGIIVWIGFLRPDQNPSRHFNGADKVQIKAGMIALTNHSDQVRMIILPDSSKVWLNPGSAVQYKDNVTAGKRKVRLTGEAFFDIRHDASRPFIVVSQHMVMTVLGTSFLVKANTDGTGEVTVLSGKVAVERRNHNKDKVILTAKQSVLLNARNKFVKETVIDKGVLQKWQRTDLAFNNTPFEQVIHTLDKKFGVQMYCLDDKIYQYKLNADFNNQNMADILEMLGISLNINYKMINDSTISFYEKNNLPGK